ncbi:MAG: glycosyltransferase family 25 protein [Endomicrobia bacterium]|nr:glycosyltransferase family 25 protein [Endomicrobiia bacterium]
MEIQGYIIHIKNAPERKEHMLKQIKNLSIPFNFVMEGDRDELTPEIISSNFKGDMAEVCGYTSCTYKHLLVFREMIKNNIPYGLIFENDVFLEKNFETAVFNALKEVKERNITNFFLSLEDSFLKFVRGSVRKKGRTVYKVEKDEYTGGFNGYITRACGAFIVDLEAAKSIIKEVDTNKCGMVTDWFYAYLAGEHIIDLYYLHPTIASQGTHNGKMRSLFPGVNHRPRWSYLIQRAYKRLLWRLR